MFFKEIFNIFFIPQLFIILAIAFPLSIINIFRLKVNLNIGKLNESDIRKLHKNKRMYLFRQTTIHFLLATILTILIGIIFTISRYEHHFSAEIICFCIQLIVGVIPIYSLIKKANKLKQSTLQNPTESSTHTTDS